MMSLEERQNNERLEQEAAIFNVKLKIVHFIISSSETM